MNKVLLLIVIVFFKAALSDRQSEQDELLRIKRQDDELADCNTCGLSFDTPVRIPVIINGTNVASSQKYPWMVALIQTGTDHIFCGGAIISRNFILTAGHCLVDIAQRTSLAQSKSRNRYRRECPGKDCKSMFMSNEQVTIGFLTPGWYTGVKPVSGAADIMVHPEFYYTEGKPHDIALIRLAHPIKCNTHANPICLPPPNVLLEPGTLVRITGFGQTDPNNPVPAQELSEALIQVSETSECMSMGFLEEDLDRMYCLKGYRGETPCFGDSGGSMFGRLYNQEFVTLGVASLQSSPHCDSRANIVYTSVANHLQWIHQMMEENAGENGEESWEGVGGMKGKVNDKGRRTTKSTTLRTTRRTMQIPTQSPTQSPTQGITQGATQGATLSTTQGTTQGATQSTTKSGITTKG